MLNDDVHLGFQVTARTWPALLWGWWDVWLWLRWLQCLLWTKGEQVSPPKHPEPKENGLWKSLNNAKLSHTCRPHTKPNTHLQACVHMTTGHIAPLCALCGLWGNHGGDVLISYKLSLHCSSTVCCKLWTCALVYFILGNQLPDESNNTTSTINVSRFLCKNTHGENFSCFRPLWKLTSNVCFCFCLQVTSADDVIYADVILPVASGCVWTRESESTDYACVRYR